MAGGASSYRKRAVLAERINFCLGAIVLCFGIAELIEGLNSAANADFLLAALFPALAMLSRRPAFSWVTRMGCVVLCTLRIVAFAALFGREAFVHGGLIAMVGLPWVLFDPEERASLALGNLLPFSGLLLLQTTRFEPFGRGFHVSAPAWYGMASMSVAFAFVFVLFFSFYRANVAAETALLEEHARLITASKFSALGEMAAGIAHEINNPLTAIQLRAGKLRREAELGRMTPESVAASAHALDLTAGRIAAIVRALRVFSRDADRDPMRRFSLDAVVEDLRSLCQDRFRLAGIEFRLTGFPSGVELIGNPVQISQILVNLLNNAHDAVQGVSEPRVEIKIYCAADRLLVVVEDSGPGVPPEIRPRLFRRFFTTKEVGKGTGLGLSVSAEFARGHGGDLRFNDKSPATQFVLELPLITPPFSGLARAEAEGARPQSSASLPATS